MNNERNNNRFSSYAKILMDGTPGYMRDISTSGFKYVTLLPLPSGTGEIKQITIIPQNTAFSPFKLEGEIRWTRKDHEGFQICGVQIRNFKNPEGERSYSELQDRFST